MLDKRELGAAIRRKVDAASQVGGNTWDATADALVETFKNTVEVNSDFLPHTHPATASEEAIHALNAEEAKHALLADEATHAANADHATTADSATSAGDASTLQTHNAAYFQNADNLSSGNLAKERLTTPASLTELVGVDYDNDRLFVYDASASEYKKASPANVTKPTGLVGIKKLVAKCHYGGNGVQTQDDDIIVFGQKYGGSLCSLFDGAPLTDGSYVSGFVVQKPAGETGTLVKFDMWSHGGVALYSSGNLYGAGYNSTGYLGLGNTTAQAMLVLLATTVTDYRHPVHNSYDHNAVRLFIKKADGYWYGAGYNLYGALGIGNATNPISSWTQIPNSNLFTELYNLGGQYGCTFARRADGSLWAAGYNGNGQLGNNSVTQQNSFVDVSTAWGVTAATTIMTLVGEFGYYDTAGNSSSHVMMLLSVNGGTTGTLKVCGNNTFGQLGTGNTTQYQVPKTPINIPSQLKKAYCQGGGPASCYVLDYADNFWTWGYNSGGQLGRGNTTSPQTSPAIVTITGEVVSEIFADAHAQAYSYVDQVFVQTVSGKIYSCGTNGNGALGLGHLTTPVTTFSLVPFDTTQHGRIVDMAWNGYDNGGFYITALTDKGKVFAAGYNGRRGISLDGETTNKTTFYYMPFEYVGGRRGDRGSAGTMTIGTVTAGDTGAAASVTNVGTANDAVLNFVLPRGNPGTTVPDVSGLTLLTDPDLANDRLYIYDASASASKNIAPESLFKQAKNTVTGTNGADLVYGQMADSDYFRLRVGGTASNAGFVEIATADEGTEPIYVRQYTGVFSSLVRTATLLDESGNTTFPGMVSGNSFKATSTRTAKENISLYVGSAVDLIKDISIVNYNYINDAAKIPHIGFIAEDTPMEFTGPNRDSMDINSTIGLLLKAIQELNARVEELERNGNRL